MKKKAFCYKNSKGHFNLHIIEGEIKTIVNPNRNCGFLRIMGQAKPPSLPSKSYKVQFTQ
jgi:hypothetical protein